MRHDAHTGPLAVGSWIDLYRRRPSILFLRRVQYSIPRKRLIASDGIGPIDHDKKIENWLYFAPRVIHVTTHVYLYT
jgi:hypothetical protein